MTVGGGVFSVSVLATWQVLWQSAVEDHPVLVMNLQRPNGLKSFVVTSFS